MESLFLLDNELVVELSDEAQEVVTGGLIVDLDQDYSISFAQVYAANGPSGSVLIFRAYSIESDNNLNLTT
ncbi:MAG: hypothetical protein AB4040_09335 [Synechococcus sp.]